MQIWDYQAHSRPESLQVTLKKVSIRAKALCNQMTDDLRWN